MENFQTASKGIRNYRQQENLGRAGKEEPAWNPVAVYFLPQRSEERGNPLNFVQYYPLRQSGNEPDGVALSRNAGNTIVKTDKTVSHRLTHRVNQRGLAALTGTVNEHSRRISKGLL